MGEFEVGFFLDVKIFPEIILKIESSCSESCFLLQLQTICRERCLKLFG